MEAPPSSSAALGATGDVAEAHKKSKKHKKRHKHDRRESAAGTDDVASGQEGPIKIRIRVGGEEDGDHKKKKKKRNKDKDKEKKHKHKHKDRKRTREVTEEGGAAAKATTDDSEIPAKRIALEDAGTSSMTPVAKPPLTLREREQRSCVIEGDKSQRKALNKLLDHLCVMLEKKDSNGFFSNPVTDQIAPGYSQIIKQPMDFFTMRTKLDAGSYTKLKEFLGKA
jgi:bromodomain-containing protein 7/9